MAETTHFTAQDPIAFRYSFRFKSRIYLAMLGCYAFVCATACSALMAPPEDPKQWPWLLGLMTAFTLGAVHLTLLSRRLNDTFVLDDHGITRLVPDGPDESMAWEEIGGRRERFFSGTIVLASRDGAKRLKVSDRIEDFELLRACIEDRIRNAESGRWEGTNG